MLTPHARVFIVVSSLSMVVVPLAMLFGVRDLVAPALHLAPNVGDAVAIVCSVLAIQLVLVGSCFCAYTEDLEEEEEEARRAAKQE